MDIKQMTKKRFRVNDLVRYNYSEIGEYIDENHTDRPLMNNEVVELLNELYEENNQLKKENEGLQDENYGLKQTVAQLVKESKETSQKKEKYNIQPYAIMKKGDVE